MKEYYFNNYFKANKIEFKKHYFNSYLKEYFKKIQEDNTTELKEYFKREESNYDLRIERAIFDFETRHFNYICKIP